MSLMRELLLGIVVLVYPYLIGTVLCYFYKKLWKKETRAGAFLLGLFGCFGGFELLALIGIWRNLSWKTMTHLGLLLVAAGLLFVGAMLLGKGYRSYLGAQRIRLAGSLRRENLWYVLSFLLLAAVYFLQSFSNEARFQTPETVVTILQTESLYAVNPLTGTLYSSPLSLAQKLMNVPLLYAMLAAWSGVRVTALLFQLMPLVVLLAACRVMKAAAEVLLPQRKELHKVFLLAFALVTLCGNDAYMNTSYGLLHLPYEGSTWFETILLPLAFVLLLENSSLLSVGDTAEETRSRRGGKALYLLCLWTLLFLSAAFLNGLYKGWLILLCEMGLFFVTSIFYRAAAGARRWRKASPKRGE